LRDPIISPVVLLHLPNCIPFVVLELAGWAAGLTVTTVNNVLKPDELAHVIRESRPSVIFTTPGGAGLDVINKALKIVGDKELSARLYDGRTFIVDPQVDDYGASTIPAKYHDIGKIQDWKTLLKGDGNKFVVDEYKNGEDESKRRTSLILWSSGTSGKSKGVVIPNSYLTYGMKLVWLGNRWYTGDEVSLPLFFSSSPMHGY
jgi:4-coumarate--CoA ligase